MVGGALNLGVTTVEIKEIVYQAVPYCGIVKVLDFIHAAKEILVERGGKLPLEGQSAATPENRLEKGLAAQKEIFGARIDQMYKESPKNERPPAELRGIRPTCE
jgi:4-carboxymuconolactone decarboxylase